MPLLISEIKNASAYFGSYHKSASDHKKQKQRHSLNKSSASDHIIKNKNSPSLNKSSSDHIIKNKNASAYFGN
jgi:hypothetical protein